MDAKRGLVVAVLTLVLMASMAGTLLGCGSKGAPTNTSATNTVSSSTLPAGTLPTAGNTAAPLTSTQTASPIASPSPIATSVVTPASPTSKALTNLTFWLVATKDPNAPAVLSLKSSSGEALFIFAQAAAAEAGQFELWGTPPGGSRAQLGRAFQVGDGKIVYCTQLPAIYLTTPGNVILEAVASGKQLARVQLSVLDAGPADSPPSINLYAPVISGLKVTINGVTLPGASNLKITKIG